MAEKKSNSLSFVDIVTRADAATIRAALEARVKIDDLLIQREEAYRRIADAERQIEEVIGEDGAFEFPEPPVPVFYGARAVAVAKPAPKVKAPRGSKTAPSPEVDSDDENEQE